MSPQDSPTPPAPAEVCERLRYVIDIGNPAQRDLLTAALLLIEQGEKERERLARLQSLVDAVGRLSTLPNWEHRCGEWKDVNGEICAVVTAYRGYLNAIDAARAQPTPESK